MISALALAWALGSAGGTVQHLTMAAPSLGDPHRAVQVYLPPSYFRPEAASRRYPAVYLLHGWPGSEGNWFGLGQAAVTADSLIAHGQIPEVILICPNGRGRGLLGRSLYINSYDGSSRMEDFVVHDLVAWADGHFRTQASASRRAIIGLSEGGTAALNLAFRHREVFGACGGHSADYGLDKGFGMGRVIGPEPRASRLLAENSPLQYVDRVAPGLRGLVIYFDCGLEDDPLGDNRELHRKLRSLGIPHTYREFPGTHTWGYWRRHLRDSLKAVTAAMRRVARAPPGAMAGRRAILARP
ncbi:MAG TPA: alpha/beta hydrolase-fold protein [Candidatus Eisenbacteria bacterium]